MLNISRDLRSLVWEQEAARKQILDSLHPQNCCPKKASLAQGGLARGSTCCNSPHPSAPPKLKKDVPKLVMPEMKTSEAVTM